MRRCIALLGLLLMMPTLALAGPFRLGSDAAATSSCHVLASSAPGAQRALHRVLAQRLGVEILDCPVAGSRGAADALAAGQIDMGVLDPVAYGAVTDKVRAILSLRAKGGLSRTQVVTAVQAASPYKSLSELKGRALVFVGRAPYDQELPRRALTDQGANHSYFSREVVASSAEDALGRLRRQDVDVVVMNADAWQRSCRGAKPQDQPCADLRVVWQGRPRAEHALVVRSDMPAQLRYRLIGIFVAMHLEAPEAFMAASSFAPGGENFDAAEAAALSPKQVIP